MARFSDFWNFAVAIICMVLVILRIFRTALRRLTIARALAIALPSEASGWPKISTGGGRIMFRAGISASADSSIRWREANGWKSAATKDQFLQNPGFFFCRTGLLGTIVL